VEVTYETLPDREKPTLRATSEPRQGTKVKAGDKIRIDITARDDANAWQTGIKSIQVLDNEGLFDHQDYAHEAYGGPVSKCEPERRTRTWWTTYTVPDFPPPIVRLKVISEDFAGNQAEPETAEFPTGDWYGRIESRQWGKPVIPYSSGESENTAWADLALNYDDKGNLAGQALGSATIRSDVVSNPPNACYTRETEETETPAKLQGDLIGSYTPGRGAMSITVTNDQSTPLIVKERLIRRCTLGNTMDETTTDYGSQLEILAPILQALTPTADGGFEFTLDQSDTRITVWLRQAAR
jgi:hypothetical protein